MPDADFCGALWGVEASDRNQIVNLVEADPFYVAEYRTHEIFHWGKILEDRIVEL